MNVMERHCVSTEKNSLMNSLGKLQATVSLCEELEGLSEKLIDKFKRTENDPKPMCDKTLAKQPTSPDIIDLFNITNERMSNILNRVGNNIETIVNLID